MTPPRRLTPEQAAELRRALHTVSSELNRLTASVLPVLASACENMRFAVEALERSGVLTDRGPEPDIRGNCVCCGAPLGRSDSGLLRPHDDCPWAAVESPYGPDVDPGPADLLRRALNDANRPVLPGDDPRTVCLCTHPLSDHNVNRLCTALPGVMGCGCLGFIRPEDYRWSTPDPAPRRCFGCGSRLPGLHHSGCTAARAAGEETTCD